MYRNHINIDDSLLDKPVYRIMPIHRLLEALEKRQLTLVKPKKWDDPFENALLASEFETPDGRRVSIGSRDSVYGQCWTRHRETDAMWRIYSHHKDGVRVTSTPRKLFEALIQQDQNFWKVRCFLGHVTYQGEDELLKTLGDIKLLTSNGSGIAESLLYKREEFQHEQEVRLIYCGPDENSPNDIFPFAIDPGKLFEEITFDPRMDGELVEAYTLAIKDKGFKNPPTQSALYRAPKGLVFKLGQAGG